jgi:hypothetical protein
MPKFPKKLLLALRIILAIVGALIIGGIVNTTIINISGAIIPPPEGADLSNMEGLKKAMVLFEPKHFLMPFLAHALGTFSGALICSLIVKEYKIISSLVVALFFFIGGFFMVLKLPSPVWFNVIDLVFAYFPMAWLGSLLIKK